MDFLRLALVAAVGYLIGSIPMGVLLARLFGWSDPRTYGSGHTGALNISRQSGKWAFVVVLVADTLKGLAAVWAGFLIYSDEWAFTAAGIAAVIGHCWPIWLRFKGGMGLATGMGTGISLVPQAVAIGGVALVILRFGVIKHTPRATVVAALLIPPAAWFLNLSQPIFWLVLGVSVLIAYRHVSDWKRVYE